jgi:protein-S-isoprenylcysteine O-methyltransferase Ste14
MMPSYQQIARRMHQLLFGIALLAMTVVLLLSILKYAMAGFEFWPPPNSTSWQRRVFRSLFRVFFVTLVALSIIAFNPSQHLWRYVVGAFLLLVGFGFALRWTNFLGWGNAFGNSDGLKTEGPYRFSRNPIYMITLVGMVGWALLINSWMVTTLLGVWACLYIAAPFLEEPWMKKKYGDAFTAYMSRAPRYGSPRRITKHLLTQLELKIPPLVIVMVSAAVMYACAATIQRDVFLPAELRIPLASLAGIVVAAVLLTALAAFRRHQTTMNPLDPNNTTALVATGIYAYSRNPMYLSMLIALLGWGFFLGQLSVVVGLVLYLGAITRLQIVPEERILECKFGCTYMRYLNSSHRWFGLRR